MCSMERIPNKTRMLKEFLHEDDCSSSAFVSHPLRSNLAGDSPPATLPRSYSRSRAAVSSLRKLLRRFSLSSSLAPATFRMSFSKRMTTVRFRWPEKKPRRGERNKVKVKVKVKDILRWRSFRDDVAAEYDGADVAFEEKKSRPLDSAASDVNGSNSDGGSMTRDESPCWWAQGDDVDGEKWDPEDDVDGGEPISGNKEASDSADVGPKDNIVSEDEKEQNSPVSILDSPFRDETLEQDLISVSPFNQSLANVERTKQRLLESIQWFESLAGLDDPSSLEEEEEEDIESILELQQATKRKEDNELLANKKDGISTVYSSWRQCWSKKGGQGLKDKMEYIKEMDRQRQWINTFGEEIDEVGVDMEVALFHDLVDELLLDLSL